MYSYYNAMIEIGALAEIGKIWYDADIALTEIEALLVMMLHDTD